MMEQMSLLTLILLGEWSDVSARIKAHPEEVMTWNNGLLPLSHACKRFNVPPEVISQLIEKFPESVHLMDPKWTRIPLHWAIRNNPPNIPVIKVLLKNHPDGVLIKDENGQTVLNYYICFSPSPSLEIIKTLVEANVDVVGIPDKYKWTALHLAVKNCNWEIIKYLIEKYPESLLKKDINGLTPRYHAKKIIRDESNINDHVHDDIWQKLGDEEKKRFGQIIVCDGDFSCSIDELNISISNLNENDINK